MRRNFRAHQGPKGLPRGQLAGGYVGRAVASVHWMGLERSRNTGLDRGALRRVRDTIRTDTRVSQVPGEFKL